MEFVILTLFPEAFEGYLKASLLKRAQAKKIIKISVINLRDYAQDRRGTVDDRPYGGGAGMVLRVDVINKALRKLGFKKGKRRERILLMTPQGEVFSQGHARKFSAYKRICILCGRYEGFDERVRKLVDTEVSLGDFVLTGGEIPALAVLDATARLIKGVVGKEESLCEESFGQAGLLEYPQYTRPEVYNKMRVPKVLLSGNHKRISEWRQNKSFERTAKRRPDLIKRPKT
jgi:tRNA (guanine37-N1)-methyltransferase